MDCTMKNFKPGLRPRRNSFCCKSAYVMGESSCISLYLAYASLEDVGFFKLRPVWWPQTVCPFLSSVVVYSLLDRFVVTILVVFFFFLIPG